MECVCRSAIISTKRQSTTYQIIYYLRGKYRGILSSPTEIWTISYME